MRKALISYIDKVKENTLNYNSQLRDILIKDSIYNAAGIVSFPLYDEVNVTTCYLFINFLFCFLFLKFESLFISLSNYNNIMNSCYSDDRDSIRRHRVRFQY